MRTPVTGRRVVCAPGLCRVDDDGRWRGRGRSLSADVQRLTGEHMRPRAELHVQRQVALRVGEGTDPSRALLCTLGQAQLFHRPSQLPGTPEGGLLYEKENSDVPFLVWQISRTENGLRRGRELCGTFSLQGRHG